MSLINKIDGICHHHLLDAVVDVVIYSQNTKQHASIMNQIFYYPLVDFSPKRYPIGIRMIGGMISPASFSISKATFTSAERYCPSTLL